MGIKTIDVFKGKEAGEPGADIAQNTTEYSKVFNLRDLHWSGTDMEIGFMVIASSATTSNSITITFEGSFDGNNFNTGVAILTTVNIGDGNPDYGSFNVGIPYPFFRVKATENNNGVITDLRVILAMPTIEKVR